MRVIWLGVGTSGHVTKTAVSYIIQSVIAETLMLHGNSTALPSIIADRCLT